MVAELVVDLVEEEDLGKGSRGPKGLKVTRVTRVSRVSRVSRVIIFYPSFCAVRGMNECCASKKMTKCHFLMNEPHYQMRVGMHVSGLGYAVVLKQEIKQFAVLTVLRG